MPPEYPELARFAGTRPFRLDPFQVQACRALEDGSDALVCAPTGAGKTLVGEFAVSLARRHGTRCFYTTPIKALSNQKYADFVAEHGEGAVGLLTGDVSINPRADVVVMTTEVLRNMLYARSTDLDRLGAVVLDEIHYLADRFRGAVWEEVILRLPDRVQLVGLSATVSNAEEFGDWLRQVRGDTAVVVDEVRPVPLWQHVMVGRKLYDLYSGRSDETGPADGRSGPSRWQVGPDLQRAIRDAESAAGRFDRGRGSRPSGRGRAERWSAAPWRPPRRSDVVERLDGAGLLPAITFIFSRAGCDAAVQQCLRAGLRLVTDAERAEIRAVVDRRIADLPEQDLAVLGVAEWREALQRGIAAHHAGLLPAFKQVVEELFVAGLVKVVFATETLALGINMPARTVVLERLVKWGGEGHVDITPGEYTQLTGRAGRRGIDIEGHAVVLWSPGLDAATVGGLASTRTFALRSSFRPGYNMAVNLVDTLGRDAARDLLEQSFAQFQTDRELVGLARQVASHQRQADRLAAEMVCDRGDVGEYLDLQSQLAAAERAAASSGSARRRRDAAEGLAALHRGDVIHVPAGRRAGLAVVLDPGVDSDGVAHPLVATENRWAGRLSVADFRGPVPVLGRLKLHKVVQHGVPKVRRDLASALAALRIPAPRRPPRGAAAEQSADLDALRRAVRGHPVHSCPDRDEHARLGRRYRQLTAEIDALSDRVRTARNSLAAQFDRILALLADRGYVDRDRVSAPGRLLERIWAETDLLAVECLRRGTFDGLGPAELAGAVSALVFDARRESPGGRRAVTGILGDALADMQQVWSDLAADERRHGLPVSRAPDGTFAAPVAVWAEGGALTDALVAASAGGVELSAGDFVRWCRQVIDLLDQIRLAAGGALDEPARRAVAAIRRGVVAMGID